MNKWDACIAGCLLTAAAHAMATETASLEMEVEAFDLDAGAVVTVSPSEIMTSSGGDIMIAYNSDRTPHAVAMPAGKGVEIAVVTSVGFDGVTAANAIELSFSGAPVDLSLLPGHCVVVRTDQGALFKIGNAVQNDMTVSFNYAAL